MSTAVAEAVSVRAASSSTTITAIRRSRSGSASSLREARSSARRCGGEVEPAVTYAAGGLRRT